MQTQQHREKLKQGNTEHLQGKEEFCENTELFRTIFEKAALGIVVTNPKGRILQSNPFFQQLLGYSPEEIIGHDIGQFTHPDDVENEQALFPGVIEEGQDTIQRQKRYVPEQILRRIRRVIDGK
jgi:PAS domain S-box-containing protein